MLSFALNRLLMFIALCLVSFSTLATQFIDENKYRTLLEDYRSLVVSDPESAMNELQSIAENYEFSREVKADLYYKMSDIAYTIDNSADILRYSEIALNNIKEPESSPYTTNLLIYKAYAYGVKGDDRIEDVANRGISISREKEDIETELQLHLLIAGHSIKKLRLNSAHRHVVEALKLAEKVGKKEHSANALLMQGKIHKEMGSYTNAIEDFKKAEALYRDINFYHNLFYAMTYTAEAYIGKGDTNSAKIVYKNILDHPNIIPLFILEASIGLAKTSETTDDYSNAIDYIEKSKKWLNEVENVETKIKWYIAKVDTLRWLGKLDEAEVIANNIRASKYFDYKSIDRESQAEFVHLLSEIESARGDYTDALETYKAFHALHLENEKIKSNILFREVREKYLSDEKDKEISIMEHRLAIEKLNATNKEKEVFFQRMMTALCLVLVILTLYAFIKQTITKRKLSLMIHKDSLTSVYNRHSLMKKGAECFSNRKAKNGNLSVILLDVDNFKYINDNYGHAIGDNVLKEIAKIGDASTRDGDWFGRLGGEEFVAILPSANASEATVVAERIRKSIYENNWHKVGLEHQVSASIGVASDDSLSVAGFNELLNIADKEMYKAKKSGKNKVCVK